MALRSLLFAPVTHGRHVEKALTGAADGVILDLEDAIAIAEKPAARLAARQTLSVLTSHGGPRVYVRVNGLTTPFTYDDLLAIVGAGLDGIVLPKVESAAQLATVDWLLTQLERASGLAQGAIEVMPIIETAAGLARVGEIAAAAPRVRRLNFGAGDFSLDTNMTWTAGHEGILWARIQVVVASRAAGLEAPIDTVYAQITDDDGLRSEADQAKRLGFQGKACIHPRQVEIVNTIFSPSAEELAQARVIVEAFAQAEARGVASLRVGSQFIDYPVAARARRTLDLAEQIAQKERTTAH
ncbi:MAG TPA: CoA ester lyase [Ktedonobacterales bacterium]|jgi:citrate lyase subunit beta/citryl-CoA lyase|nr:CoA ester lyase [Ktedonobacterales bacterium]